jgi:hypothetical protein
MRQVMVNTKMICIGDFPVESVYSELVIGLQIAGRYYKK